MEKRLLRSTSPDVQAGGWNSLPDNDDNDDVFTPPSKHGKRNDKEKMVAKTPFRRTFSDTDFYKIKAQGRQSLKKIQHFRKKVSQKNSFERVEEKDESDSNVTIDTNEISTPVSQESQISTDVTVNVDEEDTKQLPDRNLKRYLAMFALALFVRLLYAGTKICVQSLGGRIPSFQLNAMRCTLPLFGWSLYFLYKRTWPQVKLDHIKGSGLWSMSQVTRAITANVAIGLIPLATAETVRMSSNIVSSLVVFGLFMKHKHKTDWSQVTVFYLSFYL